MICQLPGDSGFNSRIASPDCPVNLPSISSDTQTHTHTRNVVFTRTIKANLARNKANPSRNRHPPRQKCQTNLSQTLSQRLSTGSRRLRSRDPASLPHPISATWARLPTTLFQRYLMIDPSSLLDTRVNPRTFLFQVCCMAI